MATMILSAAGGSLGGFAGGSALGLGAAALGKAAGAVAGGLIDQQVLGRGAQTVESGRLERIRLQSAGEGAPIPRLFGRMRVGGQLIWSSRFHENVNESSQGGKSGGPRVREYSYTISFAIALCEGPVQRIGRIWADGNEISLSDLTYRLHRGGEDQTPDPLIDDIEGGAPAFKGLAYMVFEDLPLSSFGNRIPQLNVEVFRAPPPHDEEADAPPVADLIRGVALSPGSGEFVLDPVKTRRLIGPGRTTFENVNTMGDRADVLIGLDQLEEEAPNCDAVSLVVSWFGDDLRCGRCRIQPCVETDDKETDPSSWRVSGVGRSGARAVGEDAEGRPVYGGTPSDGSVIRAIQEMNGRGMKVMFYPFILMDLPEGNGKVDPWSGAASQPAFPWRGRITLDAAPGRPGSSDKTLAAEAEVASFFGAAQPSDFSASGDSVAYSGAPEWSFRRFILHYAHLCAAAGGVDSFCIGSEMRSLTQIRSGADVYPSVENLRRLANEVRSILGPDTKIGYAADWSEYFGHQPGDGTGDAFFHLDPLWADDAIDFVGIDNYLPISDWRYREVHADQLNGAKSVYDLEYLDGNVEGGEGYDWFYADLAARRAQVRSPIVDTAHGENWLFRPKDIRGWWENPHHNRPGGVRAATPTAWTPRSKPIWFTEIGCPAVDLGANQPNVFVDPKSSENALPYFSRGVRDDYMQQRYLQASLTHWRDPANNPSSPIYQGPMIDLDRTFVWTWDVRPWPDFPARTNVWSDGPNHRLGHWISGRLGAAPLADVVAEICRNSGVEAFDVSQLYGVVQGYVQEEQQVGRAALQPLMTVYAFDAVESGGVLKFRHRNRTPDGLMRADEAVLSNGGGSDTQLVRAPEGDLPRAVRLGFIDSERDYETSAVEATAADAEGTRVEGTNAALLLDSGTAQDVADRFLAEARAGRDSAEVVCPRRVLAIEPGDIVALSEEIGAPRYRVERIDDDATRAAVLTRIELGAYSSAPRRIEPAAPPPAYPAAPLEHQFMDLPLIDGDEAGLAVAAFASPWSGTASVFASDDGETFERASRLVRPASMGVLLSDLPAADPHVWTRGTALDVQLFGGGLSSLSDRAVLNGANRAAVLTPGGEWEVLQFRNAELIAPEAYRLERMLRGQLGTEAFIGAPTPAGSPFVLLDRAVADVAVPDALRGVERSWRIGPSQKPFTHDSYVEFQAADRGVRLRPYAPTRLKAVIDRPSGDIQFDWVRRSRVGGDPWDGAAPPLGELREAYRFRIGAVREVEVEEPRFLYSASSQAADGVGGEVEFAVSQISDQFGPGPETRVTLNV